MTTNDVLTRECPGPVAERAFASPRRGLRARRNRAWHWALVIHWSLVIGGLVISPASAQPNVSGSGNSSITDKETTTPFDNLNISSSSDVTVTITFPAAQGTLSPLAPFFTQSGDTYTLDATNDSGATGFTKGALSTIIYALLIIVFLVFEPRGLAGIWRRIQAYFRTWPHTGTAI